MLRAYAEHLPPGFPCVSKVWNQITVHTFAKAQDPARAGKVNGDFLNAEMFIEAVYQPYQSLLRRSHGPVRLRVPGHRSESSLGPREFADRLDHFFAELPREGEYAVEVRNEEFLTPMYFAVLREHGVAHVFSSWTRMPALGDQLDLPGSVSGPFIVARALLRPGRTYDEAVDAFAPYDRIQEPNPELRRDLLRLIDAAVTRRIPAYLLVNNRAEGSSPLTVAEVARMLPERAA